MLGLETTFHRAFDQTKELTVGEKPVIAWFDRLLTSGTKRMLKMGPNLFQNLWIKPKVKFKSWQVVHQRKQCYENSPNRSRRHTLQFIKTDTNETGVKNTIDEEKLKHFNATWS